MERAQDTRARGPPSPLAAGFRPLEQTAVRPITILLVENNDVVSRIVKKTLELEGWRVEVREDGGSALRELEGEGQYDLIITENELPGANGLELIRRTRLLPRHRQTPIIMFSSGPHRAVALSTGADMFLNKPEGIYAVGKAVAHLLATPREHA